MGNPAKGLKIKPSERAKVSFQQSYPQFMGLNSESVTNQ